MAGPEEKRGGGANRLLKGWKQIALYFGKDESTAKRWAASKNLPVHRVPGLKRAAVYAYSAELDLWLTGHRDLGDEPEAVAVAEAPRVSAARSLRPWLAAAAALALCGAALGGWLWRDNPVSIAAGHRPNPQAESLYLDGVYHLEARNAQGISRAVGLFTQAVAEDPAYAKAYVGLANAYNLVSQYTPYPAAEAYPKAKAAAERAIALEPKNGGAYAALAFNAFYWQREPARAVTLFEKAVALEPGNARAHHWFALVAMHDRRFDVALREIMAAQRLEPQAASILANKGLILFHAGRVPEALAILQPLAETQPDLLSPHAYLATIYLAQERYQDFLREYRQAATIANSATELAVADASDKAFAAGGSRAMLEAMLAVQKQQYAEGKEPAFKLALTAAMLGEKNVALGYLDASIRRHEQDILGIRLEPALASLHGDSRYRRLVTRTGFTIGSLAGG